ncbi:hypothetical protein O7602_15000 [Micromonospora sp. WMMD1128]|uniref:hypothetical protein n=1 Tax=unclassified Micromonospora TaxID=2617518 RepID=UPI00248AE99E|nr:MULTISPECIES: hypothetical protein [unclassified Micromonospora]WBB76760.1 hypothetical protein O7602_15000 [Micromonospora sp. WMMD1128]WFE35455.1 hypothetical protein O7613_08770 [Micromonospora sp. WMMD975]
MTAALATVIVVLLVAGVVGYVSWRDRRRTIDEDPTAVRAARAERHRRAAEQARAQHDGWNSGGHGFTG